MGAHWKQIRWNVYRLVNGTTVKDFPDYDSLYRFCQKNNINAAAA